MENVKVDCLVRKKRERKGKEGGKKTSGSHNFLSFQCWKEKGEEIFSDHNTE